MTETINRTKNGWFERADSLLGYAKRHHDVAYKKEFAKEFPDNRVSITPNPEIIENMALEFDIPEAEREQFQDICGQFYDKYKEVIDDLAISTSSKVGNVIAYVPNSYAEEFKNFVLKANPKFVVLQDNANSGSQK